MEGALDEGLSEARLIQQDIIRMDAKIKLKIAHLPEQAKDELSLLNETRGIREMTTSLAQKIERLALVCHRMTSRAHKQSILTQVEEHKKELEANKQDVSVACQKARVAMEREGRSALLGEGESAMRRRVAEEESAERNGERLSLLVQRMAGSVGQSEEDMINLVRSSETLGKTHEEYGNQAAFIQTGNKLLSKWERRELTDKIVIVIALLLYFAAVAYVVNKRFLSKLLWFW